MKVNEVTAQADVEKGFDKHPFEVYTPRIAELADKYGVGIDKVMKHVAKGVKAEGEHTTSFEVALEIALDHIAEKLDYYDRLADVEEAISNSYIVIDPWWIQGYDINGVEIDTGVVVSALDRKAIEREHPDSSVEFAVYNGPKKRGEIDIDAVKNSNVEEAEGSSYSFYVSQEQWNEAAKQLRLMKYADYTAKKTSEGYIELVFANKDEAYDAVLGLETKDIEVLDADERIFQESKKKKMPQPYKELITYLNDKGKKVTGRVAKRSTNSPKGYFLDTGEFVSQQRVIANESVSEAAVKRGSPEHMEYVAKKKELEAQMKEIVGVDPNSAGYTQSQFNAAMQDPQKKAAFMKVKAEYDDVVKNAPTIMKPSFNKGNDSAGRYPDARPGKRYMGD